MQVRVEDHFENSSASGSRCETPSHAGEFSGRRPWGLDAKGAHLEDEAWSFDHGIRRSPAEELLSKGGFTPARDRVAAVESERCALGFRYRLADDGTAELLAYEGPARRMEIPAALEGAPVASVALDLFRELPHVEEVRVDGASAHFATDGRALFSKDGSRLVRLVVPCASYEVPAGCAFIEEHAFDSVAGLERVSLPETLEGIGRLAFAKTEIEQLSVPASVRTIGEKAFYHCARLARVLLPEGLVEVQAEAFAFSGVRRVELPATLERLGFRAFDHTPAQKRVAEGALAVLPANPRLHLDAEGGLYRCDVFVELVGQVASYAVRPGTHAVGDGAFKRHGRVRAVELPEGVFSVGREAFRGNRQLTRVDLPESLERIGERAFLDTSLSTLRLSANVRSIGDDALLVQGDNQLMPRTPLRSVELDEANPVFYLEGGLLCRRDGSKTGGDACLLYVGPHDVVRIPEAVTHIASMAFCGADGVNELYLHGGLQSICNGAFSTARSIPLVHVAFPEPVDGYEAGDFPVPSLSPRYRSPSYLFGAGPSGTVFDFEYYDSWVTHATAIAEFAPAGLYRLAHPMRLPAETRELYEGIFRRKARPVCRHFAEKGNLEALAFLAERDLVGEDDIEAVLRTTTSEGRTQATACLLELKHRLSPSAGVDFSL